MFNTIYKQIGKAGSSGEGILRKQGRRGIGKYELEGDKRPGKSSVKP